MSGQAYERYLASVYEQDGYNTTLTSDTNDKGIDILAEKEGVRVAIQAKHYQSGNKVSSPAVQRAAGLHARPDIHGVVVATTSSFTEPAREVANNRNVELQRIAPDNSVGVELSTSDSGEAVNSEPDVSLEDSFLLSSLVLFFFTPAFIGFHVAKEWTNSDGDRLEAASGFESVAKAFSSEHGYTIALLVCTALWVIMIALGKRELIIILAGEFAFGLGSVWRASGND